MILRNECANSLPKGYLLRNNPRISVQKSKALFFIICQEKLQFRDFVVLVFVSILILIIIAITS